MAGASWRVWRRAGALFCAVFLTGCAATGGPLGLTREQQLALGRQEHPKIVRAFGGEIQDPELRAYVDGIVARLMAASDRPNEPIKTTVLDSPVVNAMALPGHVYVTRGLLALANSEAELAGVLGHEIGHIFEQHTAERVSRSNLAGLGAAVVGILTGDASAYQMAGQAAQLYLLRFSRTQEYEADLVGVRLLAASGYETLGEARFLNTLNRWSQLEAQVAGRPAAPPEFLSTHPNTAERVRRAAEEANVLGTGRGEVRRTPFLAAIDDMLYGDDPVRQGFVRDSVFYHPEIGFAFAVPSSMTIANTPQAVIARGPNAQLQFVGASSPNGPGVLIQQLSQQLQLNLGQPRRYMVNGRLGAYGAARAETRSGPLDVQAFAVQWSGPSHFVFLWVTPAQATPQLQRGIEQSVQSLRSTQGMALNPPQPLRIDVATVPRGATLSQLAAQTRFPNAKEQRLAVINGLARASDLKAGERVKLVK